MAGARLAWLFRWPDYNAPAGQTVRLMTPEFPAPIFLRAASSDTVVFRQLILRDELHVPLDPAPEYILDAGANIGLATLVFASLFPGCRIAAVEPDPGNLGILRHNISHLDRVTVIEGAVWFQDQPLACTFPAPGQEYGVRVLAGGSTPTVAGLTMHSLLARLGWPRFDLVKMDIEGAEYEVFSQGPLDWLRTTSALIVEPHDRFKRGCTAAILRACHGHLSHVENRGEYLILRPAPGSVAHGRQRGYGAR